MGSRIKKARAFALGAGKWGALYFATEIIHPMTIKRFFLFICFFVSATQSHATAEKPILGNPDAPKGGTFVIGYASYPKNLHHYLAYEELAEGVNRLVLEPLVDVDPDTYEVIPLLADHYTVSRDHKVFTFHIAPKAQFSDGTPVTALDVKFTWDLIMNPKTKTAPFQSWFSSFESCRIKDDHTIEFKAKTIHFKNLEKLTELLILPQHFYSVGDFNKDFGEKMLGSGPYTLAEVKKGDRITVKRNPAYWGAGLRQNIGRYNFDTIVFKGVPDYTVQYEMFKRGDLDYFYFLVSKMWATETDGPLYQKNYIKKLKGENLVPYGMQGIAWNLRRPLFQDRRVRQALAHLMNREKFIQDLFYNNYVPTAGPAALHSPYHSPRNIPLSYDPKKAKTLLDEAGWTQLGPDGVLEKNGQRFEFELLAENPMMNRFLTIYQEDLKRMGIQMNIRNSDWATAMKLVEDWAFDAYAVNQTRDVHPGDNSMEWGSREADMKGSANHTGYKNPEVDRLAAEIDTTFDESKRVTLTRRLDEIVGNDQPMAFTWEMIYFRVAYWNRFSFPEKGYFNFSYWRNAFQYWWYDAKKDAKLKKAMADGVPLS